MTKTRKEKQAEFRKTIAKSRKLIRQYVIMMLALLIGWHVATGFMNMPPGLINDSIVLLFVFMILGLLIFNVLQIKRGQKLLSAGGPKKEKTLNDLINEKLEKTIEAHKKINEPVEYIKYYDGKALKYKTKKISGVVK